MTTIDRNELATHLRHQISTAGGTAYFTGGAAPDPALAELFPDVADAKSAVEAIQTKANEIRGELHKARAARAAHKNNPAAVFTPDPDSGLVFSDARGVELQNEVKRLEKAAAVNASKAKNALLAYLVAAFARQPEAIGAFTARAIAADAEAQELATKLTAALANREKYWNLAGQPYPGVSDAGRPAVVSRRADEQAQYARDLEHLLNKALPFPSL